MSEKECNCGTLKQPQDRNQEYCSECLGRIYTPDPIRAAAEEMFKEYMGYEPEEGWRCEERRLIDKICALVERERERIIRLIREHVWTDMWTGTTLNEFLARIRQGG